MRNQKLYVDEKNKELKVYILYMFNACDIYIVATAVNLYLAYNDHIISI